MLLLKLQEKMRLSLGLERTLQSMLTTWSLLASKTLLVPGRQTGRSGGELIIKSNSHLDTLTLPTSQLILDI